MTDAEPHPVLASRPPRRTDPSLGSFPPSTKRRWSAPRQDGEVLADPLLADTPRLIQHEQVSRAGRDQTVRVAGVPLGELRRQARGELAGLARGFAQRHKLPATGLGPLEDPTIPLVVTGHQPDWIHPGVWFKMIAAHALARRVGGAGLNVAVDQDLLKRVTLKVPDGHSPDWTPRALPFDRGEGEAIHEFWRVRDLDLFASLAARVRQTLGSLVPDPLIEPYQAEALRVEGEVTLGERHTVARARIERAWGLGIDEIPMSGIARTESFLTLLLDLATQAERFRMLHNIILHEHRRRHKIRSRHHPFADLGQSPEGWVETPFWVWSSSHPRRRPLLARGRGNRVELAAPESLSGRGSGSGPDRFVDFSASRTDRGSALEALARLDSQGIRIRPRALTTTLFLRWCLADWFLHGIGGAHYDQLGDLIASRWFQAEPPPFSLLSLTKHLRPNQPDRDETLRQRRQINQRLRDLAQHPEQQISTSDFGVPEQAEGLRQLMAEKRQWINAPTTTRAQRAERCRALRRIQGQFAERLGDSRAQLIAQRDEIESRLVILDRRTDREYAIVLHSATETRALFQRILAESDLV